MRRQMLITAIQVAAYQMTLQELQEILQEADRILHRGNQELGIRPRKTPYKRRALTK